MNGDFFTCGCGVSPCICYRQLTAQPVWIGDNTCQPSIIPIQGNPPSNPLMKPIGVTVPAQQTIPIAGSGMSFGGLNSNFPLSLGTTFRRHTTFKKGQMALINWSLVPGGDAILYDDEPKGMDLGATTWISSTITHRKQLHLFEGREVVVLLDDVGEFAAEARISYGEKVGWLNAYLLIPVDDDDVKLLGGRKKKAPRKTRHIRNGGSP